MDGRLRGWVREASLAADRVVRPPAGVTMLIYHQVGGGTGSLVDLEPDVFEAQLEHLSQHCRVLMLEAALAELTGGGDGDGRPAVVVTFDDGTEDFTDVAVPLLVRHGVPATLYAATSFIDEHRDFPWGASPTSWAALRDAASTGLVSVGSHTHSHWLLDRTAPDVVERDLDRSIELIGAHLDVAPVDFAYPKAVPGSPEAEIAVRRRFRSAVLAGSRVNRPGRVDVHRLWRTPVQRGEDQRVFAAKAAGGMRLEGELRAVSARVRYRGLEQ